MKKRSGTPANCELRARAKADGITKALPLVHMTAVGVAREIVQGGQLETRLCNVLNKNLLYFFSLKAAYSLKLGDEKSHQLSRFPFVFVVRPEAVKNPFHVYPFDTGAASDDRFSDADPHPYLQDYELMPSHDAVAGHIGWAFGSTKAYFDGELREDLIDDVPDFEFVTRGFVDIARMASSRTSNQAPDARASAIEVTASHHVPLKNNVLLAIIPDRYLESETGNKNDGFIERLAALNIPYETYPWHPNLTPNFFRAEIKEILRSFYDGPPSRW